MKELDCSDCQVHVLVCTNERSPEKSCCFKVGGHDFYARMKAKIKEFNLYSTHWITRTGCLGFCNDIGTTVVIEHKGEKQKWYNEVTPDDFGTIWEETTKKI